MITEVSARNAAELAWFKSSYSSNEGGACVEVAHSPAAVHVRDSKDPQGPHLTIGRDAWDRFVRCATGS